MMVVDTALNFSSSLLCWCSSILPTATIVQMPIPIVDYVLNNQKFAKYSSSIRYTSPLKARVIWEKVFHVVAANPNHHYIHYAAALVDSTMISLYCFSNNYCCWCYFDKFGYSFYSFLFRVGGSTIFEKWIQEGILQELELS